MSLIRDVEKLEPKTRYAVKAALEALNAKGVKYYISETLRLSTTQYCYWLQGRGNPLELVNTFRGMCGLPIIGAKDNANTITRTVKSKHIEGKAIDIVPATPDGKPNWAAPLAYYETIAEAMKAQGMAWGGDWADWKDYPHYELAE